MLRLVLHIRFHIQVISEMNLRLSYQLECDDTYVKLMHAHGGTHTSVCVQRNYFVLPCGWRPQPGRTMLHRSIVPSCRDVHLVLMSLIHSNVSAGCRLRDVLTLDQILTPYIHPTESDPVTRQR